MSVSAIGVWGPVGLGKEGLDTVHQWCVSIPTWAPTTCCGGGDGEEGSAATRLPGDPHHLSSGYT